MISPHSILSKLINGGIYDNATYWAIPLSIIQLLSVFFLMGAISEDYLALNVNLLCNSSNLLVSVLMAFCNSSPDLISNFVAWYSSAKLKNGSGGGNDVSNTADTLALSEVLGACGTIMFMAVGFILLAFNKLFKKILIQRFENENINGSYQGQEDTENNHTETLRTVTNVSMENKINLFVNELNNQQYMNELDILLTPLLNKLSNDMIFFSLGFSLILMCCKIKEISLFVCIVLLVLYFMFMLNSIRHHKKHSNDITNYESSLADQIEMESTDAFNIDNQEEADMIFKRQMEENNSFLENDNLNFFVSMFDSEEFNETNLANEDAIWDDTSNVWETGEASKDVLKLSKPSQHSDRLSSLKNHSPSLTYSDNPSEPSQVMENAIIYDTTKKGILEKLKDSIVFHYIQRKIETFKNDNIFKKAIFLMTEPVLLLAVAVCPRYTRVIPKKKDSYLVLGIQCYTSVFFMVFVCLTFIKKNYLWVDFTMTFVFGSMLMGLQFRMRNKYRKISEFSLNRPLTGRDSEDRQLATSERINNTARYEEFIDETSLLQEFRLECCIFSLIGIINSILWIVILSNNLIQIIEFYQETFNISETILGMTLFAWGNSVPDILSNVAVLKLYANDTPKGLEQNYTLLYKWQVQSLVKYCHISIVTCISSSTINSMIGIGFNAMVAILKKRPFEISWSLKDISSKTQIHLLITSSSVLVYVMIVALILKLFVKQKSLLQKYIINGYFNKREVVMKESKDVDNLENGTAATIFKLKINKFLKFFGIYVILTWLSVNFINVMIEILL